jgi:hypothetical protein
MATRKMTFIIPEDLALQFVRRVPARERSRYLADALSEKLTARERALIEANSDPEVRAIEKEFDVNHRRGRRAVDPCRAAAKYGGTTRSRTRIRNS